MKNLRSYGLTGAVILSLGVPESAHGETRDAALAETQRLMRETHKFSARDGSFKLVGEENSAAYSMLLRKSAETRERDGVKRTAIQQRLVTIARGQAADPSLMGELVQEYGAPIPPAVLARRVHAPVRIRAEHAAERYRLAREALLLAPLSAPSAAEFT